jgi:outer membrane protein OmpA-like peptidoglycan-associated protein
MFVIDVSGSMSINYRLYQAKKFGVKLVQQYAGRGISFGVLSFGGGCNNGIVMELPFTPNTTDAINAINNLQLRGSTPLAPAIEQAYNEILKSPDPDNSRVILLNDGANGCGDVGEVLARRKRDLPCVQFTAIGIELQTDESGRPTQAMADLQRLAAETKGEYLALEDVQNLERVSIAPNQPLQYTPPPPKAEQPKPAPPLAAKQPEAEPIPQKPVEQKPLEPESRPEPKPLPSTKPREIQAEPVREPIVHHLPQPSMEAASATIQVLVKDGNGDALKGFVAFRNAATNALETELYSHDGRCSTALERGAVYTISVDKPDYVVCNIAGMPSSLEVRMNTGVGEANETKSITLYLCAETRAILPQSPSNLALPPLLFYVDTDVLLPESQAELRSIMPELRSVLASTPTTTFVVEGHTSDEGPPERNLRLSVMRAQAIVRFLRSSGLVAERLDWEGFGRLRPVAENTSEDGRRLNRRVEIRVK